MLIPFELLNPTTVNEASAELARLGDRAKVYAGGAELLVLMRHRLIDADALVNIKSISPLNRISWDGKALSIGACVTHRRLETDPLVRARAPMFADAEARVANIRVRHQGTLGGNLCFNDPHSDPGTALLIYDASVTVAGSRGKRRMALQDFLLGMHATALEPDEILVEVSVPPLPSGWGSAYLRIHRLQRPTLGVAAAVKMRDGNIEEARLSVGCVGPRPERLSELETTLRGTGLGEARTTIAQRNGYLRDILKPVDDLLGSGDYKLYLTQVLLGRALAQASAPTVNAS